MPNPLAELSRAVRLRPAGPAALVRASRALDLAVDYAVPGTFVALRQPSDRTCWATVTAMMVGWKRQESVSIVGVLRDVGQHFVDMFLANDGLASGEKPAFLAAAGLLSQAPQSLTPQGWESLLRRYGPIWVTTDEAPDGWFATHARVVTGIHGDGSAGPSLDIADPADGRRRAEAFSDFFKKYEKVVGSAPLRVQIVHWPTDAAIGIARSMAAAVSRPARRIVAHAAAGPAGAVIKAGVQKLVGKVVDQVVGNSSVFGNVSFEGVQKAHVLLPGYDKADDYYDVAPAQTLLVRFNNLGGGLLVDGLSGGCEATWSPVTVNPAKLPRHGLSDVRAQMEKTVCLRDIEVTCKSGVSVGLALTKGRVSARIRETHLDPGVLVIGDEQHPFVRASLVLKIELDPASIGGVPTSQSSSAEVEVALRPGSVTITDNKDKAIVNRRYVIE